MRDACELYVLMCLVHQGYLQINQDQLNGPKINRFYQMMLKLPSEIEMGICFRTFHLRNDIFSLALLQDAYLDIKAKFQRPSSFVVK